MKRTHFFSTLLSAVLSFGLLATTANADITLSAGSSMFNYDSDGSGDFLLQRGGFTNVLDHASFYVWVSTDNSFRELGSPTDNGSNQVDFAPELNIPSIDPDTMTTVSSGSLTASLVFTNFYENAQGHAVLDYELRVNGSGIHSNPGALRTRIRLFSLFDYDGNGSEESYIDNNGNVILKDQTMAPGEGSASIQTLTSVFNKVGVFDLNSGPFTETSYQTTPLTTTGSDMAGGHWQSFVVPQDDSGNNAQNFTFVLKGSISAIPEPGILTGLLLLTMVALCYRPRRTGAA